MESKLDDVEHTSVLEQAGEKNYGSKLQESSITPSPGYDEPQYVHGIRVVLVLAALTLVFFTSFLDMSIIATVRTISTSPKTVRRLTKFEAIPHITTEFHSLRDVGWYGSAFLISS